MTLGRVVSGPGEETDAYHLVHGTWSPSPDASIHVALAADLVAPGAARRAAGPLLAAARLPAEQVGDVALMLSELVTNALRHPVVRGACSIDVRVAVSPERVRAEVGDAGDGLPVPAQPILVDAGAIGGRGLLIVDRLASRWGSSTRHGHTVWFELDR